MVGSFRGAVCGVVGAAALTLLAGCASTLPSFSGGGAAPEPGPPPVAAAPPSSIRPDEIVGRWGYSAFHRPEDRARTESKAREACSNPYIINRSSVGVAMLGHDSPQVQDMLLKAGPDGRSYIGPNPPAPDNEDREVVSFDGRVLVLRWVDPEVAGRYGNMLLVRCGAEGTARRPRPAPSAAAR